MPQYNIVYADPPWFYDNKSLKGAAEAVYSTMRDKDIMALDVQGITAENAVLFLWATMPKLPEAIQVMQAWGFRFLTCGFTWIKTCRNTGLVANNGLGFYTRGNAEMCLLGVKGRLQAVRHDIQQIVFSPRQEHSRKPHEVRLRIVQLFGDLPRVELFAREKFEGWDTIAGDYRNTLGMNDLIEVEWQCDKCGNYGKFIVQKGGLIECECGEKEYIHGF